MLRDEATDLLQQLLRIDTSNPPGNETAAAELLAGYLERNGVACELVAREPHRANLVAQIPGDGTGPSLMLLGHTDVVPADAGSWRRPPFGGELDDDGYVWGRGALDMKNEVATRAVAIAEIARSAQPLSGDLVFVAAADEEDGTNDVGVSWLVDARPDLETAYVLNEGANERLRLTDGRTVAAISVGEKSAARVRVTALGDPGHASTPGLGDRHEAVPALAELILRLCRYRARRRLLPQTQVMLERLLGTSDLGDLDTAIDRAIALHPALEAMIGPLFSTTIAPTQLRGSDALNVIPGRASVDCDCRLLPGTTGAELLAELADALGTDIPHQLELVEPPRGGTISPIDSPLFAVCDEFLREHDPGTILVPTICAGFTDSHYMRERFGSTAYGFWPIRTTPPELVSAGVHGHDERIHVDDLGHATEFHVAVCRALLRPRAE